MPPSLFYNNVILSSVSVNVTFTIRLVFHGAPPPAGSTGPGPLASKIDLIKSRLFCLSDPGLQQSVNHTPVSSHSTTSRRRAPLLNVFRPRSKTDRRQTTYEKAREILFGTCAAASAV